ncbi:hypothetical protein [Geodermatophilus saharensis]|nr:hypothetical protein [Geodermatophilus saharensis]
MPRERPWDLLVADGFARLALGRRSRIEGATVVGPRAGEARSRS